MNIPKEAIERAIEGGWTLGKHYPNEVGDAQSLWQLLTLDATFWQALGKALGWYTWDEQPIGGTRWFFTAHRFYDLILSGKDTTEFWADLLGVANK